MIVDDISPSTIGEDRIALSVDNALGEPQALKVVSILIDYDAADPEGIALPLELIVQPAFGRGGKAGGYIRRVFRRSRPTSFAFVPIGAGQYLLLLREMRHNRWQGRLLLNVAGDPFQQIGDARSDF